MCLSTRKLTSTSPPSEQRPTNHVPLRRFGMNVHERGYSMEADRLRATTLFRVNRKRVCRIYHGEGLQVRRKKHKQKDRSPRVAISVPPRPHERWSIDFVSDTVATGRSFRALTVVDDLTRLCPLIEVDTSSSAERVTRSLDRAAARTG